MVGRPVSLLLTLCVVLLGAACTRPLASGERALARDVFGEGLSPDKVRVAKGFGLAPPPKTTSLPPASKGGIAPRPGICDRVPRDGPAGPPPAFALYNRVHMMGRFYKTDTAVKWPEQVLLPEALIMAHELTHVWQWQNRKRTGYRPARAALESVFNLDPYFYRSGQGEGFLTFGYEQQAALVEDYLCYAILDPTNPQRSELRTILAPYFQVDRIDASLSH